MTIFEFTAAAIAARPPVIRALDTIKRRKCHGHESRGKDPAECAADARGQVNRLTAILDGMSNSTVANLADSNARQIRGRLVAVHHHLTLATGPDTGGSRGRHLDSADRCFDLLITALRLAAERQQVGAIGEESVVHG